MTFNQSTEILILGNQPRVLSKRHKGNQPIVLKQLITIKCFTVKNFRSRYLGSRICLEEKRDEYHRRCSSDKNSVDDENDGGIDVGGAPVAPRHQIIVAEAEVYEPLRFLDDSTI